MDGRNPAPPKKAWNDDSPVKYQQWFQPWVQGAAKWTSQPSTGIQWLSGSTWFQVQTVLASPPRPPKASEAEPRALPWRPVSRSWMMAMRRLSQADATKRRDGGKTEKRKTRTGPQICCPKEPKKEHVLPEKGVVPKSTREKIDPLERAS